MFNMEFDAKPVLKKSYKTFISQLNAWDRDGTTPMLASEDMRFALELQRQHWKNLGLDVHQQIKNIKSGSKEIPSVNYSDRIFINHIVGTTKMRTTKISRQGQEIYDQTDEVGTSVVIQQLKEDTQPLPDMALSCPHCGAPTTMAQIESGCTFCGTGFIMDELYPKVTNAFFEAHPDADGKRSRRSLILLMGSGVLLMLIYYLINYLWFSTANDSLIGVIIAGLIIGFMVWVLTRFLGTLARMGKDMRGAGKAGKSLRFRNKIRAIDPEFSSEHFRDRAMNLFRIAAFSEDATRYTSCSCQRPDSWDPVIDATLQNFGVNRYSIKGNDCTVDLTLYMDCLIYRKGKIKSRAQKYDLVLHKKITQPTDLGFSIKAVSCPSCSGSFDAEQVRYCPHCGNEYDLSKYDWVLTDIR